MSDPAKILGIFQRIFEAMDELDQNLAGGTNEGGEDEPR